jgi:hypothetical protein
MNDSSPHLSSLGRWHISLSTAAKTAISLEASDLTNPQHMAPGHTMKMWSKFTFSGRAQRRRSSTLGRLSGQCLPTPKSIIRDYKWDIHTCLTFNVSPKGSIFVSGRHHAIFPKVRINLKVTWPWKWDGLKLAHDRRLFTKRFEAPSEHCMIWKNILQHLNRN